jgi:hypothetical protein
MDTNALEEKYAKTFWDTQNELLAYCKRKGIHHQVHLIQPQVTFAKERVHDEEYFWIPPSPFPKRQLSAITESGAPTSYVPEMPFRCFHPNTFKSQTRSLNERKRGCSRCLCRGPRKIQFMLY